METELKFEVGGFLVRCFPDGAVWLTSKADDSEEEITAEEFEEIIRRRKALLEVTDGP